MSLDLGTLFAQVDMDSTLFDRKYAQLMAQMRSFGVEASKAGGQTAPLERGLAGVGTSSDTAATGLTRASTAMREAGVSASDAASATGALARAQAATVDVTTEAGLATSKLSQAQLRSAAAVQRVSDVQTAAAATARRLAVAEADLAKLQSGAGASADKVAAAQERVNGLQAASVAVTGRLAGAQASLIAANDRVAISQERVGKSAGLTSSAWQSAGHKMLITGGLIGAAFAVAGKEAIDFDSKMALVRTLSRASATEMDSLRKAALSVGQQYGFTAGQVADAEAELVKAGISVKDILGGALTGALTLAAAGQENVAQATETATIAMTQFGLKGKDVPHIADLLAAGADKALGSVSDLSEALKFGGLAASQAGFSIQETVGTLAEFAQAGQTGSSAGSILAQMLRSLEKPTTAAQATMKQYGITVYDASGQMKSSTQIAGELHDKIGALPQAQRDLAINTLFTSRAIRGANILMKDGAAVNAAWIKTVNDQGFAALQASGKMNSLSGDLTKLKAALQVAFIGTGEGATGPLRSMTQDVTRAVEAWNHLPGPVKSGATALGAVTGTFALLGGAVILAVPKIQEFKSSLAAMTGEADAAKLALAGVGRAVSAAILVIGASDIGGAISRSLEPGVPAVDGMSASLVALAKTGNDTGTLAKTFGANFSNLGGELDRAFNKSTFQSVNDTLSSLVSLGHVKLGSLAEAQNDLHGLDLGLASLVTSGHIDLAQAAFNQISDAAQRQGKSVSEVTKALPHFGTALNDAAVQSGNAAAATGTVTSRLKALTGQTVTATEKAQKYADTLHALTDPLFAENQALTDLKAKQDAYTKAIDKYGTHSSQAKQALEDMASSSLNVAAASRTLAAAVKSGDTSVAQARETLHTWVKAGLITQSQAKAITSAWGGLIHRADGITSAIHGAAHGMQAGGAQMAAAAQRSVAEVLAALKHGDAGVTNAGVEFSSGFAAGITAGQAKAIHAAAAMGALSYQAAKNAIQSRSPSRLLRLLGLDGFAAGFRIGIEDGTPGVVAAATRMATAAYQAAKSSVYATIATAVAPAVTDPGALAGTLGVDTSHAISLQQRANELQLSAKAADAAAAAAKRHAQQLSNEAHAAATAAANMTGATKADQAAKHAAEEHSRALAAEARTASQAATAATNAATKATNAWNKAGQAAQTAAQKAADAANALVSNLASAADQMVSTVQSFISQISGDLTGDSSLSSIWQSLTGTDANGNPITPTLAGVNATLNGILASAQQFSTDLNQVVAEGGGQDLITQLAGMGTTAGDALAEQLLAAGPAAIAALSATMASIQTVAGTEAQSLANAFYGPGENAIIQFIDGLEAKFPALKKALQVIVNEIEASLGVATGTTGASSSSGSSGSTTKTTKTTKVTKVPQLVTHGFGVYPVGFPHFAAGVREFAGGLAMVGERGPELVTLPRGASVTAHGGTPRGSDGASLFDMSGVESRLDALNARVDRLAEATGQAVGVATLTGYREAGQAHARQLTRDARKR